MRKRALLLLALVLSCSLVAVHQLVFASAGSHDPSVTRYMTIKVVFVGFEEKWIDKDYFTWGYQTPNSRINNIWNSGNYLETGVTYELNYDLTFASQDLKTRLVDYLKSIGEKRNNVNRWFYYHKYSSSEEMWIKTFYKTDYVVYDAGKVEDWFYRHSADYGGLPENGWVLILTYLPELPVFTAAQYKNYWENLRVPSGVLPHYYGMKFTDADLGYTLRYSDFMTGYGGVHRLWFADLSAGPTYWSEWDDLPLNTVIEDQRIDLDTSYGRRWLTQFLADYTFEAVYNIVAPEFVYDPIYTAKYRLAVNVLDDRTDVEKKAIPIRATINRDMIIHAFEDLVPYANVQVDLKFDDTDKYPDLQKLFEDNRRYYNSYIIRDLFQDKYEYVDERPVYKYLQDNLDTLVPNISHDEKELTIPMFVFAFSDDAHFAYSYKWEVSGHPERTYGGVAQGDLVMIGQSHLDFHYGDEVGQKGRGLGLTQTVIHEAGHMIGLSHPHSYGAVGDFCLTAMSYFTYDYVFGQNDKDALQRIHADKIIMETNLMVQNARTILESRVASNETEALIQRTGNLLEEADSEYAKMDYATAVKKALEASESGRASFAKAKDLPAATVPLEQKIQKQSSESLVYIAVTASAGLATGCAITWIMLKRRRVPPVPTALGAAPAHSNLGETDTTADAHPYARPPRTCVSCQKGIMQESLFCEYCGTRQIDS